MINVLTHIVNNKNINMMMMMSINTIIISMIITT